MKFAKNNIRDEILDLMVERQNEIILQADYLKLIGESKGKEEKFKNETIILAANYFTRKKLEEISSDSIKYLKKNDINVEEIEGMFSDVSKIKFEMVERLIYREGEIEEWKVRLNNLSEPFSYEKEMLKQKMIQKVNDINGGSDNEC